MDDTPGYEFLGCVMAVRIGLHDRPDWKTATKYTLEVRLENGWYFSVDKRYNEFLDLYNELTTHSEFSFEGFPPKRHLYHSNQCLKSRSEYFQKFLNYCLSIKSAKETVSRFLNVPVKDVEKSCSGNDGEMNLPQDNSLEKKTNNASELASSKNSTWTPRKSKKRGSVYFQNLMADSDMDTILQKNELSDEELLLLSRRPSHKEHESRLPASDSVVRFGVNELGEVFKKLTAYYCGGYENALSKEQFHHWDEVQNILISGSLSKDDIDIQFDCFADEQNNCISFRNFQLLVSQLDLMGSYERNGDRVEVSSNPSSELTQEVKSFLSSILTAHFLFDALTGDDISDLVMSMKPLVVPAGEDIVRQNDFGDLFYCIETGSAVASVDSVGHVQSYCRGDSFGELALIHKSPRAATVTSVETCRLWTLHLSSFRAVASSSSAKKLNRRREAKTSNKKISRKGSIITIQPNKYQSDQAKCHAPAEESESKVLEVPDEIKAIFDDLVCGGNDAGVSLTSIVSWPVMQDAIKNAFISEAIIWTEYVEFLNENNNDGKCSSAVSGNDQLDLCSFYEFCMRLQRIIDTNIDMVESLGEKT